MKEPPGQKPGKPGSNGPDELRELDSDLSNDFDALRNEIRELSDLSNDFDALRNEIRELRRAINQWLMGVNARLSYLERLRGYLDRHDPLHETTYLHPGIGELDD